MDWTTAALGTGATAAVCGGLAYWTLRLPPGFNVPLLHSTKLRMVVFWLYTMYDFSNSKIMNYAEKYYQFLTGIMYLFRKHGIVYLPYIFGNMAIVFKAEHLEQIYKTSNVHSHEQFFLRDILKTGLITNNPPSWNHRRRINNPAFNMPLMESMLDVMNKHSRRLVKFFLNQTDIDPDHGITECCFNIITECFMGVDPVKAKEYFDMEFIKTAEVIFAGRLINPIEWFGFSFYRTKKGREQTYIEDMSEKTAQHFIKLRIEELKKKGDMIAFLKKGHEEKSLIFLDNLLYHMFVTKQVDVEGVKDEAKTIVAAATDAPIMGFLYTIYMLGLHPDFQRRVQEEIDSIFAGDMDRDVTVEDLKQMKYSEMAIKEAMRIYPPIFVTLRKTLEDLDLEGMKLPSGTSILIPFHGLHRDERFFPNPEVYDPYRFLPENCQNRHPYAYLPFSGGQRNCIGQRFAWQEMKIMLVHMLRRVSMKSLHQRDQVIFESRLSLRTTRPGIHMAFPARESEARRESVHG